MSKKNRESKKIALDAGAKGFGHNPFASLAEKVVVAEKTTEAVVNSAESTTKPEADVKDEAKDGLPARVVIRCERKGRGGKTVTLIEGVEAMALEAQEQWAKKLRKAFGAGSAVEDGKIVIQGDQMERLEKWLQDAGVRKVIRGN